MADIDEYISYTQRYSDRNTSKAYEYKGLLGKGQEVIRHMDEIRQKYSPSTPIKNYSQEDLEEYNKLETELNSIQEQQDRISFGIPPEYTKQSVSVYKLQQAEARGQDIIKEMETIRFKYYPNADIENFSQEDKDKFAELESQLKELGDVQRGLGFSVHPMFREGGSYHLEDCKHSMMARTSGKLPEIDSYDIMDSHLLREKFSQTEEIAHLAIEHEIEALKSGDYAKASACMSISSQAHMNFSAHYWGESRSVALSEYREQKLGEIHKEILKQKIPEYESLTTESSIEEMESKLTEFSELSSICNTQMANEEKEKAKGILLKVLQDKIAQLDVELQEAKSGIGFQENDGNIEELQSKIEQLEELAGLPSKHRDARIADEQAQAKEEREAREKAEREAREAQERAEQEAREKAEREAREAQERAEQEAREKVEQEARTEQEKLHKESQTEKIKTEEGIKDQVGDELKNRGGQLQQPRTAQTDLWMGRANRWYGESSLARESLELSAKFMKMKSDIIKSIREEAVAQKGDNIQSQATDGR